MKRFNWAELLETACKYEGMWGVAIKFAQFGEDYGVFVKRVKEVFPDEPTHITILGSVICDEFMMFETHSEAKELYHIMEEEPFYSNVYACLVSPTGFYTENT